MNSQDLRNAKFFLILFFAIFTVTLLLNSKKSSVSQLTITEISNLSATFTNSNLIIDGSYFNSGVLGGNLKDFGRRDINTNEHRLIIFFEKNSQNTSLEFTYSTDQVDPLVPSTITEGDLMHDLTSNLWSKEFMVYNSTGEIPTEFLLVLTFREDSKDLPLIRSLKFKFATCMLEFVRLITSNGIKQVKDITENDLIFQKDNTFMKIRKISKNEVTYAPIKGQNDYRMYQNGNTVVTWWHKVEYENKMIFPWQHPQFKEIEAPELPYILYHFELEDQKGILCTDEGHILESLHTKQSESESL